MNINCPHCHEWKLEYDTLEALDPNYVVAMADTFAFHIVYSHLAQVVIAGLYRQDDMTPLLRYQWDTVNRYTLSTGQDARVN